jgi:hypothetical protein
MVVDRPTLERFVRHAQLFGTECVAETASDYLGPQAMARLRVELDGIERGRKSSAGFSVGKRRRRSREETTAAIIQLSVEGLVPGAIADKLGVSDSYVSKALRAA